MRKTNKLKICSNTEDDLRLGLANFHSLCVGRCGTQLMITLEQVLCIFVALHLQQMLFAINPAKAVLAPISIYALSFAAPLHSLPAPHLGPALTLPAFEF